MAVTLAISTCGPQLEVALRPERDAVPSLVRLAGLSPRSTLLLAAIDLLAEDADFILSLQGQGRVELVVLTHRHHMPGQSFQGIEHHMAQANHQDYQNDQAGAQ